MKVIDVLNILEELAPFGSAMEHDNVGLLVGSAQFEVSGILVCLDCTSLVIEEAKISDANLIVTHHPVIYESLRTVTADSRVYKLIKEDISVISAHTNLDISKGGVNDALSNVLELTNVRELKNDENGFCSRIGELPKEMAVVDFCGYVKEKLEGSVRYVSSGKIVKRVAVCGGSGGDMIESAIKAGADVLVSSDIKHSQFIMAYEKGLSLIDAGHFNTENVVLEPLKNYLANKVSVKVSVTDSTPVIDIIR